MNFWTVTMTWHGLFTWGLLLPSSLAYARPAPQAQSWIVLTHTLMRLWHGLTGIGVGQHLDATLLSRQLTTAR
jgi:hypothetical protein